MPTRAKSILDFYWKAVRRRSAAQSSMARLTSTPSHLSSVEECSGSRRRKQRSSATANLLPIPNGVAGWDGTLEQYAYPFDLDEAKKSLTDGGYT